MFKNMNKSHNVIWECRFGGTLFLSLGFYMQGTYYNDKIIRLNIEKIPTDFIPLLLTFLNIYSKIVFVKMLLKGVFLNDKN